MCVYLRLSSVQYVRLAKANIQLFQLRLSRRKGKRSNMSLGTGHKVFTRGCGGYSRGYVKKSEPLRGGGVPKY